MSNNCQRTLFVLKVRLPTAIRLTSRDPTKKYMEFDRFRWIFMDLRSDQVDNKKHIV